MSMTMQSLVVGHLTDSGGATTADVTLDSSGITMTSATQIVHNSKILHDELAIPFYYDANSVDRQIFVASEGRWQLSKAYVLPRVAGNDGGAVTLDIKVASGITAPASGTTQLSSTFNLKGTADTLITGTLIASPTVIGPGDAVGLDFTGTLTSAVGLVMIYLKRIS